MTEGNIEEAFSKHIELVEKNKQDFIQFNNKIKELNIPTLYETVYGNVESIMRTLEEVKGKVLIITGERGVYQLHIYIESHLEIDLSNITLVTNQYFDTRDNTTIPHENGGITKSYEYHIYLLENEK